MVITHNLSAVFTERQLGITGKSKAKTTEKLGSGYKINHAADNAAGLSISEEMRGQIRGLTRASQNITEGCSMIDTAEAAMNEQTSILQRIRELTVQSYNDTNTQEDRVQIQQEVDELCGELDKIAEYTEYNTIKVLQGNKKVTVTDWIEPEEAYTDVPYKVNAKIAIPAWLQVDANLMLDNPGVSASTMQSTQEYVIINENKVDPTKPEIYYGPPDMVPAGFVERGGIVSKEWTPSMKDNYSAVVDFTALSQCATKEDVLGYLSDLIGVGVAYECSTCSHNMQGFFFTSDDVKVSPFGWEDIDGIYHGLVTAPTGFVQSDVNSGFIKTINLQSFINEAGEILEQQEFLALSPDEQANLGVSGLTYNQYVEREVKEIAAGLVDDIVSRQQSEHFVRVTKDASDPYKVVFYDYRDDGITGLDRLEGDGFVTDHITLTTIVQVENQPIQLEHTEEYAYNIQVGANTNQLVAIAFPDTSLKALGFEDYTVFKEGYCSAGKDGKWDDSLFQGATSLGKHTWYNGNVGGHEVEETKTISGTRKICDIEKVLVSPGGTDENGERVTPKYAVKITGQREEPYSYTVTNIKMVGGEPMTFVAYRPDTLLRVDRALSRLTGHRVRLGAIRNRFDHAYLNDTNMAENLQAAESRIRDADYAEEMVSFATDSILEQAGQSMLAQANSINEGVLRLLNV